LRQVAVAAARLGEQHEAGGGGATLVVVAVVAVDLLFGREAHLRTDDQVQSAFLGLRMGADDARERTFVGERERAVAQRSGTQHQLFGVRGTRQKAEVAAAVEFGVTGKTW
jgi:hypothetical protein